MKKLLSILALAFVMASCNNSESDKPAITDTGKMDNPAADAMKTMNDATDSLAHDTMHQKTASPKDSLNGKY